MKVNHSTKIRIAAARQLGVEEGTQMRREAIEDRTYASGKSSEWDSGLINAIGEVAAAKLFKLDV